MSLPSCSNCLHWLGVGTPRLRSACGLRGDDRISSTSHDFLCPDHARYTPYGPNDLNPTKYQDVTLVQLQARLAYAVEMRARQDKHWSSVVELRRKELALAVASAKKETPDDD